MRNLLLVVSLLALPGCYKTNMVDFGVDGSPGKTHRVWTHSLIVGLVPLNEANARQICGDTGVWAVSTRMNGWQVLLSSATLSMYTPTTAKITCRSA